MGKEDLDTEIDQNSGSNNKPNVIIVFGDQWRAQATGYAGDPNLTDYTPNLDKLESQSVEFTTAVANCPVCCPYRASLITGQYPSKHGVFLNDVRLENNDESIAQTFAKDGYDTAYIGKWHLDGRYRSGFIPRQRRQGFDFWEVLNCTHDYNNSAYFGNDDQLHNWVGYDAFDQTAHACDYLDKQALKNNPFFMMLSYGPPHNPYQNAPENFRKKFDPTKLKLRDNVPLEVEQQTREDLAGYYAHIAALDYAIGKLLDSLDSNGLAENTFVLFTSDHGDMLGSQGQEKKQKPWDESIRVPFLLRCPQKKWAGKKIDVPINSPDVMPTLLNLAGLKSPNSVQGQSFAELIYNEQNENSDLTDNAALITCYSPFGEWSLSRKGREYRGLRTKQYTYVESLEGPWLLYDNKVDPYQKNNKIENAAYEPIRRELAKALLQKLKTIDEDFTSYKEYYTKWGYAQDYPMVEDGVTIAYEN